MVELNIYNLLNIIESIVPRPGPENILAEDVINKLHEFGLKPKDEVKLNHGRVDIKVGSIAIELKVKGSTYAIFKQLERYSRDPSVESIILITTSAKHIEIPNKIGNKPLYTVYLPQL